MMSDFMREFIAGGIGGACSVVMGQPLDTIRIRQQCTHETSGTGMVSMVCRIWHQSGVRGLFAGMSSPLYTIAGQNAAVFASYGAAKRALDDGTGRHFVDPVFAAGVIAGAAQVVIIAPVDLFKIQLQLAKSSGESAFGGPAAVAQRVMRQGGVLSLWRGLGVTLLRDSPSYGVYFWVYDRTVAALRAQSSLPEASVDFAAGGVAGQVSWFVCYPADVIKTRVQGAPLGTKLGAYECAKGLWQREGMAPFFRGIETTLVRAFVVNGAIFASYAQVAQILDKMWVREQ